MFDFDEWEIIFLNIIYIIIVLIGIALIVGFFIMVAKSNNSQELYFLREVFGNE